MLKFRSRIALILILFAGIFSTRSQAQDYQQAVNDLTLLFNRGAYEEVITNATALMNQAGQADPNMLYLRGYSHWQLCHFGAAADDFTPLGTFQPTPSSIPAAVLVAKIDGMRTFSPKNVEEIKDAGGVLFRVYYDDDNAWTKAIRKQLLVAHQVDSKLFGFGTHENVVLIFNDYSRMQKFAALRFAGSTGSWAWAFASEGILCFCKFDGKGKEPGKDFESDYFKSTAVHEFSHALLGRRLRNVEIPKWYNEGIAVFAGSRVAPGDMDRNDTVLKRCFTEKTLVSLEELNDREAFNRIVEGETSKKDVMKNLYSGTDAYQQSFNMVRYLLLKTSAAEREKLWSYCEESRDFGKSFQAAFGISMTDFYDLWKKEAAVGLPHPKEQVKPEPKTTPAPAKKSVSANG